MKVTTTAKNSIISAIKLKTKYDKGAIFVVIFIIAFSILLSLGTNFSPISNGTIAYDCGIFAHVGNSINNGLALYRETWENKGPLLYIIYAIGENINYEHGIYIIELIAIIISITFAYKTLKQITSKRIYSIIGIIYTFSVWQVTYEGGSLSENFALPILMIRSILIYKENA